MGLEIDFHPVGDGERSGDAITLRFNDPLDANADPIVVVIDGGYASCGEKLADHIKKFYEADHVDLMISTHPDADHINGLVAMLDEIEVDQIWMHRPWLHTKGISRQFQDGRVTDNSVAASLKALQAATNLEGKATELGIPITEPFQGITDKTGCIRVLGPTLEYYDSLLPSFRTTPQAASVDGVVVRALKYAGDALKSIAEDWDIETLRDDGQTSAENNSGAVILLVYNEKPFMLFTADAGIPALTLAADNYESLGYAFADLNWMQVPHHGSRRNVGPTILDRIVGPKIAADDDATRSAMVSASPKSTSHPRKQVTNAYRRRGARVFRTASGPILIVKDVEMRAGYRDVAPLPFYTEVEE